MPTISPPSQGSGEVKFFLPYPPSANNRSTYGRGRVFPSSAYKAWLDEANVAWLHQRGKLSVKKVDGPYILWLEAAPPDRRVRDVGNLEKGVSDFLQMKGIIRNDSLANRIISDWDESQDAMVGVTVTIYPLGLWARQTPVVKA